MIGFEDYRLSLLLLMLNMNIKLFHIKAIVNILLVPDETHKIETLRTAAHFDLQLSTFRFLWLQISHTVLQGTGR